MIAENKSSKEIGAELSIHYRTVESQLVNICQKLGLQETKSLLRFALQHKSELQDSCPNFLPLRIPVCYHTAKLCVSRYVL